MATQRMTVAKVGGRAGEIVIEWLRSWAAARRTSSPSEWGPEQWPADVRHEVDAFVGHLRAHAIGPPVVHFVEWSDMWSMGDVFVRWLTPPDSPGPLTVHTDCFEIYGYSLPDSGRLRRHLSGAGPQPFDEYDVFVARLREALAAWEELVGRAALVVIREVVGGLVTDDELAESLARVPDWLI